MPADPPIDFEALAKSAGNAKSGGYPYQIKAADLMKNFVHCLNADDSWVESKTGKGGHTSRILKFPKLPESGKYVLGAIDGALKWIETGEC